MAAFLARMTLMRAATSSAQLVHPAFRSCHSRLLSTAFHGSSFRSLKDSQPRYHLPRLNLVTQLTPANYCREFSSDKPKDVDIDEGRRFKYIMMACLKKAFLLIDKIVLKLLI